MTYERFTAASGREVLQLAVDVLTARLPLAQVAESSHSIRLEGGDGSVTITVHRHGLDTQVLAATDQLRTSRLDLDVQYFMTMLPYQPGDVRGAGHALPGALSRS
ncbi:MAG: hypothetical protein WEF86_01780 [Gemmatimonadota bacterium]